MEEERDTALGSRKPRGPSVWGEACRNVPGGENEGMDVPHEAPRTGTKHRSYEIGGAGEPGPTQNTS